MLTTLAPPVHRVHLVERTSPAGIVDLPPIDDHRIEIHVSTATATTCRDTGFHCVRRRGDVDIVPAGTRGGYVARTRSTTLELRLGRDFVARIAHESGRPHARLETRHLVEDPRVRRLAAAAIVEPDRAGHEPLFLDGIGIGLAVQLLGRTDEQPARGHGLTHAQLDRVIEYIDAHLDRPLTLGELADVAGVSSAHLRRWFAARMDQPLHRYVVHRRVARARDLLIRGEWAASEIALATGFAHQSHMARWLLRVHGVTPRALRRRGA
jgi:AraC family transcriptional regulator